MKKLLPAALLIVCLVLAPVSAGGAEPEARYDTVVTVEGGTVESLQTAMDALPGDAGHVRLVLQNRLFSAVRDGVTLSVPADKGIESLTLAYEGEGTAYISIYKTTSNIGNPDFFYFFANGVPLTIDRGVTFGTPHSVTGPGMTNMDYYQGEIALFGGGNGTDVASASITVNAGGGVNATIYGGGLNAKVNGDVTVTAHGGYRAIYGGGLASPGADSGDICADVAGKVTVVADNDVVPRRVSAPGENRINSWYNGGIHGGGSVVLGSVSFAEGRTFTARVLGGVSVDVNCLVSSAEIFGGGAVTFRGANDTVTLNADVEGSVDVRLGEKTQQAADFSAATGRYPFSVIGGGCVDVPIYGSAVQAASAQVHGDVTITAVESLAAAEGAGGICSILGGGVTEADGGSCDATVNGSVTIETSRKTLPFRAVGGVYNNMGVVGGGYSSGGTADVAGDVRVHIRKAPGQSAGYQNLRNVIGGGVTNGAGTANVDGSVTIVIDDGVRLDGAPMEGLAPVGVIGGGWVRVANGTANVGGPVKLAVGADAAFSGTYRVAGGGWVTGDSGSAAVGGPVTVDIGENAVFDGDYTLLGGGGVTGCWYGSAAVTGSVTTTVGPGAVFDGNYQILGGGWAGDYDNDVTVHGDVTTAIGPGAAFNGTYRIVGGGWAGGGSYGGIADVNGNVETRIGENAQFAGGYLPGRDGNADAKLGLVGGGWVTKDYGTAHVTGTVTTTVGENAAFRGTCRIVSGGAEDSGLSNTAKTGDIALTLNGTAEGGGDLEELFVGSLEGRSPSASVAVTLKDSRVGWMYDKDCTNSVEGNQTVTLRLLGKSHAGQTYFWGWDYPKTYCVEVGDGSTPTQATLEYMDNFYGYDAAFGRMDLHVHSKAALKKSGDGAMFTHPYDLALDQGGTLGIAGDETLAGSLTGGGTLEILKKDVRLNVTQSDAAFTGTVNVTAAEPAAGQVVATTVRSGTQGLFVYSGDDFYIRRAPDAAGNYDWSLAALTPPTAATDLAYTGGPQPLLSAAGSGQGDAMGYSLDGVTYVDDIADVTATGAGTYTVYYRMFSSGTGQALDKPRSLEVTIDKAQNAAPDVAIDFAAETLTGFLPGGRYTVGGAEVTPETGTLPIGPYLGQDLTVVKLGDGVNTTDSPGQTLAVPVRPGVPEGVAAENETVLGKGDGKLTGLTSAMEYSADGQAPWTVCPDGELPWPVGADVYARTKATQTSFAGEVLPLRVDPGQPLTVTFQTGEDAAPNPVELAYNATLTPPEEPRREGCAFGGWFRDEACTQPWDFDSDRVTGSMTLYARWTALHTHVWAPDWDSDDTHHWHPCTASGCDLAEPIHMDGYGPHSPDLGTVTTHATLDAPGERTFRCTDCQRVLRTEPIPQLSAAGSYVVVTPGAPGITVDRPRLDAAAEAERPTGGNVTVTLTVCLADGPKYQPAVAAIAALAGERSVTYMDLTLTKETVDADGKTEITPIADTNGRVLEIAVDFDFAGKENVTVYRCHGGAETLAQTDTKADGTFRLEPAEGKVYIYASKFSVYAIGYTLIPEDSAVPGGVPRYSVLASADEGGTISPEGRTRVRRGRDVTATVTPDEGFVIADVVVDRKSVGAVREYTFEKISTGHSIHAAFAKQTACPRDATCPIHPFADAAPAAWYHDGVHFCLERDLMQGYGHGLFGPSDTLTRAQLAQILYNRAGRPAVSAKSPFDDVASDAWYASAVAWAAEADVAEGYGDGRFGPEDAITREQLAAMLYRRAKTQGDALTGTLSADFPDADAVSPWAREAMGALTANGVIRGKEDRRLDPQGPATRAEAATMLHRFCALTDS